MFNLNLGSKIPKAKFYQLFLGLFAIGIALNFIIKLVPITMIKNKNPFGLMIDLKVVIGIYIFMIVSMFGFGILKRNPLSSAFILAGGGLNLIERIVNGYVLDYIRITWGFVNLYDVALWFGLLLLNYEIWFNLDEDVEINNEILMNIKPTVTSPRLYNELNIQSETILKKESTPITKNTPTAEAISQDSINTKFAKQKKTIETVASQIKMNMNKEEIQVKIPKIEIPIQKQIKPKIKIT
jgi:hypothetical protein